MLMASQSRSDDVPDLQETAEEEELVKLEEEVEQMAQKILDYRTTLPDQLSSTLSSLLESQRPVVPTNLLDGTEPQTRMLPGGPDREADVSQDLTRESTMDDSDQAEIQLLKQRISSNAAAMPVVLSKMKECMARIDKLDSSKGLIHPAFQRKRTS